MAEASRTVWADWIPRPPMCAICGRRVTLKQAHRQQWNELKHVGRVVHVTCEKSPK